MLHTYCAKELCTSNVLGVTEDNGWTGIQLDARAIRVLAHPLRSRLLSRLRREGPATATTLAAAMHTNSGATSYHLRQLESVGLVTDTGEGRGKQRLWRASTDYHGWKASDFRGDEDAAAAREWLERDYIRQLATRAERWQDVSSGWPDAWTDVLGLRDTSVTVTPEHMAELNSELEALLARYRHRGQDDPAARRIQVYTHTHPTDLEGDPHL